MAQERLFIGGRVPLSVAEAVAERAAAAGLTKSDYIQQVLEEKLDPDGDGRMTVEDIRRVVREELDDIEAYRTEYLDDYTKADIGFDEDEEAAAAEGLAVTLSFSAEEATVLQRLLQEVNEDRDEDEQLPDLRAFFLDRLGEELRVEGMGLFGPRDREMVGLGKEYKWIAAAN